MKAFQKSRLDAWAPLFLAMLAAGAAFSVARESASKEQQRNPIDGARAYKYLQQICDLGPRMSGSPGMQQQQKMLQEHFEKLDGKVTMQPFRARDPLGGPPVQMANMLVEWFPDRKERLLLVAHYDTRPLPDRDPNPVLRRNGVFIGANDGGSGTALLMELAHHMKDFPGELGVDFLLVDGEELVYDENRDPYLLGSTYFANQYRKNPPDHKYRWGVVLDMVADESLQLYQEQNSVSWQDTRPLVKEIWSTAQRLGVQEFIPRAKYAVKDDHLPLRNTAKIPTCDIIDFDYSAWHTTMDTPRRCSAASLAKVGWVVYVWAKEQPAANEK